MRVSNTTLPVSQVEIDSKGHGTNAVVTLWNGESTMQNMETDEGNQAEYTYEVYQITVPDRPGLKKDILANFKPWYAAAKQAEETVEAERDTMRLETKFSRELPETVLDLEYRLAIAELMI